MTNDVGGTNSLDKNQETSLLQMEYSRMAAEIQMHVKEYSPKFTIFGTFVTGAIVFAWGQDKYNFVYPIVPYFLFVVAAVTISQAYLIACLGERVRQIERRVAYLNGGIPILTWETKMVMKLIYPSFINIPRKDTKLKPFKAINPLFASVVLMMFAVIPIVGFCFYKTWEQKVIPCGILPIYYIITTILFIGVLWSSTTFFKLGRITDSLNYD